MAILNNSAELLDLFNFFTSLKVCLSDLVLSLFLNKST